MATQPTNPNLDEWPIPDNFKRETVMASADRLPLDVLSVTPDTAPVGVLQLVHGMCEHKERYIPFMQYMADHGWVCIIHDHRGHGRSIHKTEDLGYFYAGGYRALVNDIRVVNGLIRQRHPDLPLVLFGHSMGSMAVRAYVKRDDRHLAGLVVCGCPGYTPSAMAGRWLAWGIGLFAGGHARPKLLQRLSVGAFNFRFQNEGSANAWVCSDPEIVAAYDRNPLCNYQFTVNGFRNMFDLMLYAYNPKGWAMHNPDMPVRFISGEDDPCMFDRRHFDAAVERMHEVGYRNVSFKLYPRMRHEILNEIGKEQVWADLLAHIETLR
ncbi:MAG: lysophospholipase [Bacteroidales bacterium]|nr:lysophospholipase [Bacteroidales bacterium]